MEICDVQFSYNKKDLHLQSISAFIQPSQITSIIGPNGSGKTTLLETLSRNLLPESGYVIMDGKSILQYTPKEFSEKVAVVHQQNIAPVDLTVEKLVSYGRLPHRTFFKANEKKDEEAIDWAIASTHLEAKRKKQIGQLSGGERQRVWIAMALAQKTPIIFLDEPTTYLDMYHQIEILELIQTLNREHGLTIVMILHDLNQAIRYSDDLLVMKDGQLVTHGAPMEIMTEQLMKEVYGIDVVFTDHEKSGYYMLPIGI